MTAGARDPRGGRALALAAAVLATVGSGEPLAAQGTRGWATTTVRFVDVPSFPGTAPGAAAGETVALGSWSGVQDVALTAWGLGARGLSVTTLVRARAELGGTLVWPRAEEPVDALLLYAQYERGGMRVRLGRQRATGGLGFSGFDGAALRWGNARVHAEAYGGRSLARGLLEPEDGALAGIPELRYDAGAYLVGVEAGARPGDRTGVTLRYQREIRPDRSALVSERAALDVRSVVGGVRLGAAADWDFGFDRLGSARLSAGWAPRGRFGAEAELVRYVPFFELSTIWGFFDPVPYHEAALRLSGTPAPGVGAWGRFGWRSYGDAETSVFLRPLEDEGWRGEAGAAWTVTDELRLDGRYTVDWLPGGFLSGGELAARWDPSPALRLGARLSTFQRIEAFRLGDGRSLGAGVEGSALLSDRVRLEGGLSRYRHRTLFDVAPAGGVGTPTWSQTRGWVGLRLALGTDPGLTPAAPRTRR